MKKYHSITLLLIILIISNIIFIFGYTNEKAKNNLPTLQIYDSYGNSLPKLPLLVYYSWDNGTNSKKIRTYKEELYLTAPNNIIELVTDGIIALDFWEKGVVNAQAFLNNDKIPVRLLDNNFYLDVSGITGINTFKIISETPTTKATYIFRLNIIQSNESNKNIENILNGLEKLISINNDQNAYFCGYENGSLNQRFYVIKICNTMTPEKSIATYCVDVLTHIVYLRDKYGNYILF